MRCAWAENADAMMQAYHDTEWAVPRHGDQALFELLCLEGAQAGLSWRTVLARREAYRAAYHGFDIARVAAMTDAELTAVLTDSGVIRHRLKIWSVRDNARAALGIIAAHAALDVIAAWAALDGETAYGGLDAFLWSFVEGSPAVNHPRVPAEVPAATPVSERMSKALRKHGFRFTGPTICYAFMQASGMVDDHLVTCAVKGTHTCTTAKKSGTTARKSGV